MSEAKVNLYSKLSSMRVELQEAGIQRTGENKFSKYKYFELDDFLPQCNEIAEKHKTVFLYNLCKEEAILTLVDCEDAEQRLVFSMPLAELSIKGANGIQNIGGLATYTRRYLYLIAFEISEKDDFDPNENNSSSADKTINMGQPTKEQQDEIDKIANQLIPQVKIHTIQKELKRTGVSEESLYGRYKIKALAEITEGLFPKVMGALEKTPTKGD